MRIFVAIASTIALLLGVVWDNVSAPEYRALLTATLISEILATAGFLYLLRTSRGLVKYYSGVCIVLCLLIITDAIRRLLA